MPVADPRHENFTEAEIQQRVIFALLLPAVALAARFAVPLKEITNWMQVAYFQQLRAQGMTLKEASRHMDVSERTAKRLSAALKTRFLRNEVEYDLPVRIEFMLRAEPMSAARLAQILKGVSAEKVHIALGRLLGEGRVVEVPGRTVTYRAATSVNSLVRDTWLARIGGLNSLLSNLSDAVHGRFFAEDRRAFARTLSFEVTADDYRVLEEAFGALVARVAKIDEAASGTTNAEKVRLSLFYAPFEP